MVSFAFAPGSGNTAPLPYDTPRGSLHGPANVRRLFRPDAGSIPTPLDASRPAPTRECAPAIADCQGSSMDRVCACPRAVLEPGATGRDRRGSRAGVRVVNLAHHDTAVGSACVLPEL